MLQLVYGELSPQLCLLTHCKNQPSKQVSCQNMRVPLSLFLTLKLGTWLPFNSCLVPWLIFDLWQLKRLAKYQHVVVLSTVTNHTFFKEAFLQLKLHWSIFLYKQSVKWLYIMWKGLLLMTNPQQIITDSAVPLCFLSILVSFIILFWFHQTKLCC